MAFGGGTGVVEKFVEKFAKKRQIKSIYFLQVLQESSWKTFKNNFRNLNRPGELSRDH